MDVSQQKINSQSGCTDYATKVLCIVFNVGGRIMQVYKQALDRLSCQEKTKDQNEK